MGSASAQPSRGPDGASAAYDEAAQPLFMENAGAHLGLPATVILGGTTSLSATLPGTPQCSQG
eukprot:3427695-Alexandrium_andersonii.AAC.1